MGTRKQINLRISGSRVLGRLKKSCKCYGNPDIYAIHLLPTAYPSKKLANSREKKKKRKKSYKNISRFNGGAQNSTYSHSFCLREKTSNQFEKNLFPPPFVFCYYFSLTPIFSLSSNLHIKLEKKRNILKEKKNQLQIKKMAHPSRRIRSLNI